MDETRFDALTRSLSRHPTRRATLRLLAGGLLGGLLSRQGAVPVRAAQRPDRDGDGLFDDDEVEVYGTNPDVFDTDGDGVGDGEEIYNRDNGLGGPSDPLTPGGGGGCAPGQCIGDAGEPTGARFNTCAYQGLADCGGYCTNTFIDPNNCGFCGNSCSLQAGLICCSGGCVNTSSDAFNCGGCGNSCPSGQYCLSGYCTSTGILCPEGLIDCGTGRCVDIASDTFHCGRCGNFCQGIPGFTGTPSCENYQCVCEGLSCIT
jgi:Stigma-specific protein, Stig1